LARDLLTMIPADHDSGQLFYPAVAGIGNNNHRAVNTCRGDGARCASRSAGSSLPLQVIENVSN
jgi:hypothetical protein